MMVTPFSARMQELNATPVLAMPELDTTVTETMSYSPGRQYDDASVKGRSDRKIKQTMYDSNKGTVEEFVMQKRKDMEQGLISQQQAELDLDEFITNLMENQHSGFREERTLREPPHAKLEEQQVEGVMFEQAPTGGM